MLDGFQARWRQRFDQFASRNDDDAAIAGWSRSGLDARLRYFRRLWRGRPSDSVWLDIGCGAGTYTRLLDGEDIRVIGCDYSPVALRKAKARSPSRISWVVADVTQMPFRRASVDGVLCFGVVQALSQTVPAMKQIGAIVKPGGEAWIDALNAWCVPSILEIIRRKLRRLPPHLRYVRPTSLVEAMRSAGFEDIRLHWMPLLPGRFPRLQRLMESGPARGLMRFLPPLAALLSHSFLLIGVRGADEPRNDIR